MLKFAVGDGMGVMQVQVSVAKLYISTDRRVTLILHYIKKHNFTYKVLTLASWHLPPATMIFASSTVVTAKSLRAVLIGALVTHCPLTNSWHMLRDLNPHCPPIMKSRVEVAASCPLFCLTGSLEPFYWIEIENSVFLIVRKLFTSPQNPSNVLKINSVEFWTNPPATKILVPIEAAVQSDIGKGMAGNYHTQIGNHSESLVIMNSTWTLSYCVCFRIKSFHFIQISFITFSANDIDDVPNNR